MTIKIRPLPPDDPIFSQGVQVFKVAPRCTVAEFVGMELEQIERAKLEHIQQCHIAEVLGLPWPDPADFMPELVWTKTYTGEIHS